MPPPPSPPPTPAPLYINLAPYTQRWPFRTRVNIKWLICDYQSMSGNTFVGNYVIARLIVNVH